MENIWVTTGDDSFFDEVNPVLFYLASFPDISLRYFECSIWLDGETLKNSTVFNGSSKELSFFIK
jgi:hypothetical protein